MLKVERILFLLKKSILKFFSSPIFIISLNTLFGLISLGYMTSKNISTIF